jgi:glutamate/tyrosine decarboxylase-like PLP-dependent enzyme
MTANLLHGNSAVVGATSSGGTESIVLAIKAHREYYGRKRGIAYPEVICGTTAHAAIDKACELLHIRKVSVNVDPVTFTLDPRQVEKRITSNTILIYASAPTFMQGVIDPIEELSNVALKYDIGLHVDACLGGFVLPFAQKLGYDIPKFDFECPGVTSMSAGT